LKPIDLTIPKGAIFSEDRKYRYALWRVWSSTKKPLHNIGLNPSDAAELTDDPTIARMIRRAYNFGFGGLIQTNLHGYVSSNPNDLLDMIDAIGKLNDEYIKMAIGLSERTMCGWGSFKPVFKRAPIVLKMIPEPYCLGINSDGQPKHPLYISYDTPMIKYSIPRKES
jgi:hypothetical protein